jgi:hypothetical protein
MCIASVALVDILQLRTFMTAQLFRMLFVLKWVGFLFFARTASRWLSQRDPLHWAAAIAPILVTGEAQPLVMVGAIVAVEITTRLKFGAALRTPAAALLTAFAAVLAFEAGTREEMVRAGAGIVCLLLYFAPGIGSRQHRLGAALLVAVLIAIGWSNRKSHLVDIDACRPTYTWDDLQGPDTDIARWARSHTPSNATWLTPPDFESFRLIAERAIVADFTSIPFNDLAIREWNARMTALYGAVPGGGFAALRAMDQHYRNLKAAELRDVGRQFGAEFAVIRAATPWPGPVLYENGKFRAVRLTALPE